MTKCASKVFLAYEDIKKSINAIVSKENSEKGLPKDTGKISNKTMIRKHFGKDAESLIQRADLSRINDKKHMNKEYLRMLIIHLGCTPSELMRIEMTQQQYDTWRSVRQFTGCIVDEVPEFINVDN